MTEDGQHEHDPAAPAARPAPAAPAPSTLADRSLTGAMPCIGCRYDLRGMSVLGVCPECGTAVRATILAVVDPLADELRPIRAPRLVAACLMTWSGAALLAAFVGWRGVLIEVYSILTATSVRDGHRDLFAWLSAALVWTSGLAALGLSRPHDRVPARATVAAVCSALLAIPAGYLVVMLSGIAGDPGAPGLSPVWQVAPGRTVVRCTLFVVVASMILLMRPVARLLVARSLAMRQGRVDRQTLYAMAAAAGLIIGGDVMGAAVLTTRSSHDDVFLALAAGIMGLGWVLLTTGLLGAVVDCWRIARAVRTPGVSIDRVLSPPEPDAALRGGVGGRP